MLEIGSLVDGKYMILKEIGFGGMSRVYLAENERTNKLWAIKDIRRDGKMNEEAVKQGLLTEKEILKKLNHPNLPGIMDIIDKEDSFLIIMDYIEGITLKEALRRAHGSPLPEADVKSWGIQLCKVLIYLHSFDPPIIYRDMKPSNVMLKENGEVVLIDFGTAREYKEGNSQDTTPLYTPDYAAPEQLHREQTDVRTDIYNLGITLYHLLTGVVPSKKPPYKILPIREVNPALSYGMELIIQKCTESDPKDRYQSAAELLYDLENIDKMDAPFIKRQKRTLAKFITCAAMTLVFAGTSLFGYIAAENKKSENYDYILKNADDVAAYYNAIVTDTSRIEAYVGSDDYSGLIDLLISDGELTKDDSSVLNKLKGGLDRTDMLGYITTINVLEELKESNPEGYEEVCYQIGEAYMFYYKIGVEKDKYAAAASWFRHATDHHPVAKMYCGISVCLQNIEKFSKAEQYANLYNEYENLWNEVQKLRTDAADYDDDLKLRVWNEIVDMIRNNAKEFCEVSSQGEIVLLLDSLGEDSRKITNVFLEKNISALKDNIETTKAKIQSVRADKAEG